MQHSLSLQRSVTKAITGLAVIVAAIPRVVSASAFSAFSGEQKAAGSAAGLSATPLAVIVGQVIQAALGLLGIVLVVLIIYAGILWMTAQGNDEKVKKAKGILSNAVVGMILTFAAYAITSFVTTSLKTAGL